MELILFEQTVQADNVISLKESINGIAIQSTNRYNGDRQPTGSSFTVNGSTAPADAITYDSYGRLSTRTEGSILTTSCTYRNVGTAYTTTQVGTLRNRYNGTDHDLHYTYDPNGNILSVSDGTYTTSYTYDGLNQLIWEYNEQEQKAWQHAYDLGGNITSVTEYDYTETGEGWITSAPVTKTCTYGNSAWKDLLTGYNGGTVTYDGSGNLLSCNGKTFAWQGGHRLQSMTADGTSLAFEYNADGLRWKKAGGGATHLYFYRGTKLAADKTGTDTLLFRYDTQGNVLGFTKVTGTLTEHYTYVKNLQGDILGILDGSGHEVASYTYDAWGKLLTVTGTDLTLADRNPIRYRGYYYDTETQLYYLQSRYYDPELRRFISPDSYAQTYDSAVGANMFAYCGNEPVSRIDDDGEDWKEFALFCTVAIVATALLVFSAPASGALALAGAGVAASSGALDIAATVAVTTGVILVVEASKHKKDKNSDNSFSSDKTYLKNGSRIDYEYNGNKTGNIHFHTTKPETKTTIWEYSNGKGTYNKISSSIKRVLSSEQAQNTIAKYINMILVKSNEELPK